MDDFDCGPQCDEAVPMDCLEDVPEMRPVDPYAEHALRDNYTREMAGLDDWQADFPYDDDGIVGELARESYLYDDGQPSELTEWLDFDPDC